MKKILSALLMMMIVILEAMAQTPPPPPVLISPSNGATGLSPFMKVIWHRSPTATGYEVIASFDPNFTRYIDTWGGIVSDPDSILEGSFDDGGIWYWRMRARNASGWGNWSEVWSFRKTPRGPELLSPVFGSTGISLNPTFTWRTRRGATSYRLKIGTSTRSYTIPGLPNISFNDVDNIVIDVNNLTGTSYTATGLNSNTLYYWIVDSNSPDGNFPYSGPWTFKTVTTGPPAAPILASPVNGATDVSTSPTLSWNGSSGASFYQLQVATSTGFSNPVLDQSGITATSRVANGLTYSTTYYWRVRAVNDSGSSAWSVTWIFTTGAAPPPPPQPPDAPRLLSPPDRSTNLLLNLTLNWEAAARAEYYEIQVATNLSFSSPIVNQSGITETSQAVSGLTKNMVYYWRVRAQNSSGLSSWSEIWNFKTVGVPPTPELESPPDSATNLKTPVIFRWKTVAGANSYDFEVGYFSDSFYFSESGLVVNSREVPLALDRIHYWRVRSRNEIGISDWQTRSFKTRPALLTVKNPVSIPELNDASPVFGRSLTNPPCFAGNIGPLTFRAVSSDTTLCLAWVSSDSLIVTFAKPRKSGQVTLTIAARDSDGTEVSYSTPLFSLLTAVENETNPKDFFLSQNYPNPFNPMTMIEFSLPKPGFVDLKIMNIIGQEIETLVKEEMSAGIHRIEWKANQYPGGMYFYQLRVGSFTETRKMLLIK